jgi:hypothetical protein
MATPRKQRAKSAILPLLAPRSHTRSCDQFGQFEMTPEEQRETAELAFSIALPRKTGSRPCAKGPAGSEIP